MNTTTIPLDLPVSEPRVKQGEFGAFGKSFFPIHFYELKKFIPMMLMFFLVSFNYSILRNTKDSLVVTAAQNFGLKSGAEVLSILKVFFIIPAAFLFMMFYAKLGQTMSRQKVFYYSLLPFVIFFALFNYVLYPAADYIHPIGLGNQLIQNLPLWMQNIANIKAGIAACCNWSYTLFYIFAELWGSVALSLLFWGFANEVTRVVEAKRFYALFGIGANLALIASAKFIQTFTVSTKNLILQPGQDPFAGTINSITIAMLAATVVIAGLYYYVNTSVLTDPRFFNPDEQTSSSKKSKPKLSIGDSLKFLARSKYLSYIAALVFCYGITIVLVEATWKGQLGLQFPNKSDYITYTSQVTEMMGYATIFMMLFVSGQVLRTFGWMAAALITPAILFATGIGFSSFVMLKNSLAGMLLEFGTTPLYMAVLFGTIQNVMSKSAKYSLFDPTKEMTYIPLDRDEKSTGKAAIDVVGARLGKAGGAAIMLFLLSFCSSIEQATPYAAVLSILIIVGWIYAVLQLSRAFKLKSDEYEQKTGTTPIAVESDENVYTHYSWFGMGLAIFAINAFCTLSKTPVPALNGFLSAGVIKLMLISLPLVILVHAFRGNHYALAGQANQAILANRSAKIWTSVIFAAHSLCWISCYMNQHSLVF